MLGEFRRLLPPFLPPPPLAPVCSSPTDIRGQPSIYVCENVAREGEATEIFVSLPDLFAQRRVSFADNTPLACVSIFPRGEYPQPLMTTTADVLGKEGGKRETDALRFYLGHPVFPAFLDRNGEYIRRQWDCIKTVHKIVPPKNQFEVSLKAHFLHREETNLHLGHMVWLLTHYQPSIAERKYIIRHLMVLRDDLDARRIWVCLAIVKELIEQSFLL